MNVHIKENPKNFHRFDVLWTPTVVVASSDGKERYRLEGYLSKEEFSAFLEMGLGRAAFMRKDFATAEQHYANVIETYPDSHYAPEAVYWQGVGRYNSTHDHTILAEAAQTFTEKYQDSVWAMKSLPWLP